MRNLYFTQRATYYKNKTLPTIWDLTGKKFGLWTVIKLSSVKNHKRAERYWILKCVCGTEKTQPRGWFIRSGKNANCGCLRIPAAGRLAFGESSKRLAYKQAKRGSHQLRERRGLRKVLWNLTFTQFIAITSKACHYCAIPWSKDVGNKNGRSYGSYKCNGIDRIDSSKGYILGNCRPCCWICNRAKGELDQVLFKDWLKRAYSHYILKGEYAEA